MMKTAFPPLRMPKPRVLTLDDWLGMNDREDPTRLPMGTALEVENLRFDENAARVRPGIGEYSYVQPTALRGIGTWRQTAKIGVEEERHLVVYGKKDYGGVTGVRAGLFADTEGLGNFTDVSPSSALTGVGTEDAFCTQFNKKLFFVNGVDGLIAYDGTTQKFSAMPDGPVPSLLAVGYKLTGPDGWTAGTNVGSRRNVVNPATDNLLPANCQGFEQDPGGYTLANNADITDDKVYQGGKALELDRTVGEKATTTAYVAILPDKTYRIDVMSCFENYERGHGAEAVIRVLWFTNNTGTASAEPSVEKTVSAAEIATLSNIYSPVTWALSSPDDANYLKLEFELTVVDPLGGEGRGIYFDNPVLYRDAFTGGGDPAYYASVTGQPEPLDPAANLYAEFTVQTADGEKTTIEKDLGAAVDITTPDKASDFALIALKAPTNQQVTVGQLRLYHNNGTDNFPFNLTFGGGENTWYVLYLDLRQVPVAIKQNLRKIKIEMGLKFGESAVNTFYFGSIHLPGNLQESAGKKVWYKQRVKDTETGIVGEACAATSVEINTVQAGQQIGGGAPWSQPKSKVKITCDFSTIAPLASSVPDTLLIYRAATETAVGEAEGMNYYLVATVKKKIVGGVHQDDSTNFIYTVTQGFGASFEVKDTAKNLQPIIYDNLPYDALRPDLIYQEPITSLQTPPKTGDDAPHFIIASNTRLFFLRSNNHPNRIWGSDIGNELSVPDDFFYNIEEAGRGGYVDGATDDGDVILGASHRGNEFLVYKRRALYHFEVRAEGTNQEDWYFDPLLGNPGVVGKRAYCEIPGGNVWMSDNGIYYLAHDRLVASQVPVSAPVQKTIDEIPVECQRLTTMAYHPSENLLFVGITEAENTVNTCMLVFDLRTRSDAAPIGRCVGKWRVRESDLEYSSPAILYADVIADDRTELYLLRADRGGIDRLKIPGIDVDPYSDYGRAIGYRLLSAKVPLERGKVFRGQRARLEFLYDEWRAEDDLYLSFHPTLTLRAFHSSRSNVVEKTYSFYHSIAPDKDSNGVAVFSQSLSSELVGQYLQLELSGTFAGNVELRLGELAVSLVDKGERRI